MKTVDCEQPICPPRKLTEILISQARDLQMLPDLAVKAIAVADNPDSRIKDLVTIIAQDIQLTTGIVSLANSPLFGVGGSITSLQIAVTRVGFRQIKNMILASCFSSMMKKMDWQEEHVRDILCRHGFLTGILCSRLNKLFNLGMQGEEFMAGLVHDVGRSLLAVSIPHQFEELDPLDFVETDPALEHELNSIGTTHAEIGAWFLQRNQLPEELVSVARYHHCPENSSKYKRLIALVAVADNLANFFERENDLEYDVSEIGSLSLLQSLGVENTVSLLEANWKTVLKSSVDEVGQLIGI